MLDKHENPLETAYSGSYAFRVRLFQLYGCCSGLSMEWAYIAAEDKTFSSMCAVTCHILQSLHSSMQLAH